ncbi:hypothetical protein NA57DRAFT_71965 [Rhizodiscina lignyota]|uniref:Uncharacterized protein n=1 Tax=Rhizodiscina lignyota TaxID=1504668 RepID=A0A9P4MEV6_9PEZI|nr:hypothetical protein NA57DRAFT_71965 [Rhizodiscina lignyota]
MALASERFDGNEPYFVPYKYDEVVNDGYQSWDVLICDDNEKRVAQRRSLSHDKIIPWIHETNPAHDVSDESQVQVRVLFCPAPEHGWKLRGLPFSQETYDDMAKAWSLPWRFERLAFQNIPVSIRHTNFHPDGSQTRTLLLKNEPNWPFQFALAVVHNTANRTIHCICIGLGEDETENTIKTMDSALQRNLHVVANELFVPVTLMDICLILMSEKTLYSYQNLLWEIQSSTGLHGGRAWDISQNPKNESLDDAIIQLTALSDSCTRANSRVQTLKRMLVPIEEILSEQMKRDVENAEEIRHAVSLLDQAIAGSKQHLEWFQASIQSQVQTIYSLTSQVDSRTNINMAASGQGQYTLFSTSFFDFQPGDTHKVVSGWIWLYWTVTAGLTLLVYVAWCWMSGSWPSWTRWSQSQGRHWHKRTAFPEKEDRAKM